MGEDKSQAHDAQPSDLPKDDIHVITAETFEAETKKYDVLVLNFFVDWNQQSHNWSKEFVAADQRIKNLGHNTIKFAKIDVSNDDLASQYKIEEHPTIRIFFKGKPMFYE